MTAPSSTSANDDAPSRGGVTLPGVGSGGAPTSKRAPKVSPSQADAGVGKQPAGKPTKTPLATPPGKSRKRQGAKLLGGTNLPKQPVDKQQQAKSLLQQRRLEKHGRIRHQRLQHVAKLVACIGLLAAIVWVVQRGVLEGPLYQPPGVVVTGQTSLTPKMVVRQQLLTALTTRPPRSTGAESDELGRLPQWFWHSPQQLGQQLRGALPFVGQVSMARRLLPNRWVVGLHETLPWAVVRKVPVGEPSKPSAVYPLAGALREDDQWVGVERLSTDEIDALAAYAQSPIRPLVTLWYPPSGKPAGGKATTPENVMAVKQLAQWLAILPGWQNAVIDLRFKHNVIIRPTGENAPPLQLGPLNPGDHQGRGGWQERFKRLGPLMPYWPQWSGQISSVDLRWPTQIVLHPHKHVAYLSKSKRQAWEAALTKSPLPVLATPKISVAEPSNEQIGVAS